MTWSNRGRICFGLGYLVAALFNLSFTLRNHQILWDFFLENAHLSFYKDFLTNVIIPNGALFIIFTVIFEIIVGVLVLNKLVLVRIGLVLGLLWVIFLIPLLPLGPEMLTNIILAALQAILLRKEYETTFLEMLRERF
ncbi:MAG: hypothetical protein ACFFA5_03515 [Promethearchaeota archaeon]